MNWEIGGLVVFFATQLITYGALRQQVKDLKEDRDQEIIERKLLDERVRKLEINAGQVQGPFSFAKKTGG